ncbi:HigA family addiction module antitoxin [Curtobacterium sp. RIT-PI-V]|uniref:HigA family addiction module antitoxin n=1 Tax=Curtobacterium sp. RIT-PI-V TaxID=3035296 RepID=UPI0021D79B65|nr:HigA family addiction module antitoxin [Curtobacterium sp. RIT-PI-V]
MAATARVEAFPAGEYLADELQERGWTQAEFAEILGRPAQFVSEIISGKKEITRESAAQIGAALNTSAEMWLNLQDAYYLWRQGQDEVTREKLDDVRVRARLKELAPLSVLVRRGFINADNIHDQADELRNLYGMESLDDQPIQQIAARRSNPSEELSANQLAWTACARFLAAEQMVAKYSQEALESLGLRLSQELRQVDAFSGLPELFAHCGVALVYVEAFPGSKIDGCSFSLESGQPAIALSGRGKRLDKVLFTLLHEVAHIVLGHLDAGGLILDDPSDKKYTLGVEEEADRLASEWILPKELPEPPLRIRSGWVEQIAENQGVHPIVVVGRLQKMGALDWRTALVRGAPNVDRELSGWTSSRLTATELEGAPVNLK